MPFTVAIQNGFTCVLSRLGVHTEPRRNREHGISRIEKPCAHELVGDKEEDLHPVEEFSVDPLVDFDRFYEIFLGSDPNPVLNMASPRRDNAQSPTAPSASPSTSCQGAPDRAAAPANSATGAVLSPDRTALSGALTQS